MTYQLEIKPSARKQLAALPVESRAKVDAAIRALAEQPRPHGVEKMAGIENAYRIRIGRYRVVYEIYDRALVVTVVRIAHRRDVYR